jgi:hypothetical protein
VNKKLSPVQSSLLGKTMSLAPSAAGALITAGKSLMSGGGALVKPPPGSVGPLDELDGDTDEERAADMMNRAKAILVNQESRASQQVAIDLANDTEFWVAVYFQSREQKDAWLAAASYGDPSKVNKYLDGQKLAAHMGIELPARAAPFKVGAIDRKMKDMT